MLCKTLCLGILVFEFSYRTSQEYIEKSAIHASNQELKRISQEIEHATIGVFNGLNQVKIDSANAS